MLRLTTLCCFMMTSLVALAAEQATPENIERRGSLDNSRIRFEREHNGHVAFIGGSITEMDGYRPMVCNDLKKRFPKTKFTFTDAGISSTCSTTGAFRLQRDVLSKGPVDLFFIEFAVNDDQDAMHPRREALRGLEGIIRQCRKHNPNMDIVVTYFVNEGMLAKLQKNETPISISAHGAVAQHYGVSTIHLAREIAQRVTAKTLTWKEYGGVHPAPLGNRICADMIDQLLSQAWKEPFSVTLQVKPHSQPEQPLDANSYESGRFIDIKTATIKNGWQVGVPNWEKLPGSKRPRFTSIDVLSADQPGAECSVEFTGKLLGAYVVAGPDAGVVEVSFDGGPFEKHNLFHNFSGGLHYPRTVIFNADLAPGKHTATLRISSTKHEKSSGHAARIMNLTAN